MCVFVTAMQVKRDGGYTGLCLWMQTRFLSAL